MGITAHVQPRNVSTVQCAAFHSHDACSSRLPVGNDHATSTRTSHAPSFAAATAIGIGSVIAAASMLLSPLPAFAKPRLTPDEQLNISIFKTSTPSVVNVTNLAVRRDQFTTSMMEIPQGAGSGFIWDKEGHVVTNYHVINDASDIQVTMSGRAPADDAWCQQAQGSGAAMARCGIVHLAGALAQEPPRWSALRS